MAIPHHTKIHNRFQLNGFSFTRDELMMVGYDFIKEGDYYERALGEFIMDWMDNADWINVKTSGSTGAPKEIRLSKQSMVASAIKTGDFFKIGIGDTALHCLPTDFIAGKMMLVRAMILGLSLDLKPPSLKPLKDSNREYDFAAMIPLQTQNSMNKIRNIKTLIVGGASISPELHSALVANHDHCFETYGMTETITHIAVSKLSIPKQPFTALPGVQVSVNTEGCLLIDAPHVTEDTITTNDLVDLIDDKSFTFKGRKDNVINSGGFKIFPETVETKLSSAIKNPFFVSGFPDDILGYKLVMIIEGNVSQTDQINSKIQSCDALDKFEVPKSLVFVNKIETKNGKILRELTLKINKLI